MINFCILKMSDTDVETWVNKKENYDKLMHQLQYFRYKIEGLRHEIAPHLRGHSAMDTEECRKEFEEYRRQLQLKFERLDNTLNDLSFTLGKSHGRPDIELHEEL
jgi:hypothetical protein